MTTCRVCPEKKRIDRSRYHLCSHAWLTPSNRAGFIDHWFRAYKAHDFKSVLALNNQCSQHNPSGAGWSLCVPSDTDGRGEDRLGGDSGPREL